MAGMKKKQVHVKAQYTVHVYMVFYNFPDSDYIETGWNNSRVNVDVDIFCIFKKYKKKLKEHVSINDKFIAIHPIAGNALY